MRSVATRLVYRVLTWANRQRTRSVEVRLAATEADFEQVWRLNYETYVRELGQEQPTPEVAATGRLPDRLQATSVTIVAMVRGELVGMMVLTLPTGPFSIEGALADPSTLEGIRHRTVEYRRLAVRKPWRGRGVFLRMADFSLEWAFSNGYRYAIISALDRQVPTYARLGYEPFDRPFVKGACTYQPMMCSLDRFMSPEVEKDLLPRGEAAARRAAPGQGG